MPITINGSGTVTGISAGGLPDGCITTADLDSAVPVAKAWVNFNGAGAVAIRASYNVSSITDNGEGDYTVTFTTALADANYCFNLSANDNGTTTSGGQSDGFAYGSWKRGANSCVYSTGSMRFQIGFPGNTVLYDQTHINVAIFR